MAIAANDADTCKYIRDRLIGEGLYDQTEKHWRISPEPFWLKKEEFDYIKDLGNLLLSFYKESNKLYNESNNGNQSPWISKYLDLGKPDSIIRYGKMNRFKSMIPLVIRPDIILTDEGMIITELDSVPGGIGITGCLQEIYSSLNFSTIGEKHGMVNGFSKMINNTAGKPNPSLAIVVSDESKDYRDEMNWVGRNLNKSGIDTSVVNPKEIFFSEEDLYIKENENKKNIDIIYRFFELFDLMNIPKSELIMYAAKKERVVVTPPFKAFLEEKMWFALFNHPVLKSYWLKGLGVEGYERLKKVFPMTWILDPAILPPYAIIPDLIIDNNAFSDWRDLATLSKKDRRFVIKPSGFSELAWGSRGVSIGHDLSIEEWKESIANGLSSFQNNPYILQVFHKGCSVDTKYMDFSDNSIKNMKGRVRLMPYYFVIGEEAVLSGILATICPADKKIIHGMVDSIIAPCAIRESGFINN